MKVGAEDRKKVAIAGVLMVAALLLVGRMLLVDSGPSASVPPSLEQSSVTPVQPVRTSPRRLAKGKKQQSATINLDPRLHLDLLKRSEDVTYAGTGRNIFLSYDEAPIPRPVADARLEKAKQAAQNTPPPGPPPPPPITLKFFGFANHPGQPRKVFLAKGQDIFIAGEGDIVDRRYKVLRIGPTSIELQDVLNNNRQSIPITRG
ncbi:MAG TPA: hypothetical protein VLC12_00420 [Terriglobales bacterium]|nr:hypothetical protein [Terriglobales bacterium]